MNVPIPTRWTVHFLASDRPLLCREARLIESQRFLVQMRFFEILILCEMTVGFKLPGLSKRYLPGVSDLIADDWKRSFSKRDQELFKELYPDLYAAQYQKRGKT